MPVVQIVLFEGRTIDQKRKLVKSVTSAIVDSLGTQPESVKIAIIEIPRDNYAQAGVLSSDKK